jgi:FMN-dependent NADH-azoreductase
MKMNVLKIDASANMNGNSRRLTSYLVERLGGEVTVRDGAEQPLPLMSASTLMSFYNYEVGSEVSEDVARHLALSDELINELKAADVVVLGVPMYNFGVPVHLKNWIDHVARAGVTFRYGENGPEGLIGNTRVHVVATSGGTPIGSAYDFSSNHVKQVLGFLGATQIDVIDAGGSKGTPEAIVESGQTQIDELLGLAQSA